MYDLNKNDYKAVLDLITSLSNVKTINAFAEMLINSREQLGCYDSVLMVEIEFNTTCTYKLIFSDTDDAGVIDNYTVSSEYFKNDQIFSRIQAGEEVIKTSEDFAFTAEINQKLGKDPKDKAFRHLFSKMNKETNIANIIIFTNYKEEGAEKFEALAGYLNANLMSSYVRITSVSDKKIAKLSERELSVLTWLKHGKTSWEVATILDITENTVNFHIKNIKSKLNATNRQHAVAIAIAKNLIS